MTFTINTAWVDTNKISSIKVSGFGLTTAFQTNTNIDNQEISGTGEHKIRIPAITDGKDIILVGVTYTVTITIVFSLTGEGSASEPFTYSAESRF